MQESLHGEKENDGGSRVGEGWPVGGDSASRFRESKHCILSQAIASLSVPLSRLVGK